MAETNLTIKQIEVALYKSPLILANPRYDIAIPNLSYGLLNHEADFVVVNKSGYLTEIEIKRSVEGRRNPPQWQRDLARWCNVKSIFKSVNLNDYQPRKNFKFKNYYEMQIL